MRLSVVYTTGRSDPHLDWALYAWADQWADGDEVELILVDALGRDISQNSTLCGEREQVILARSPQITRVIATQPKPNVWQGKHRVTNRDWWAAASARNTGIALATHPQIAFVDDRCHPGPLWVDTVRRYARSPVAVAAGSYAKMEGAAVPRVSFDHRRELCPQGKENCGGGWLFGCNLTLPLAWALEVNGFEEGCDGLTGEDYIFGLMLQNAGHRIDFVPSLYVELDRTQGNRSCKGAQYACRDKGVSSNDKSHAALARFGSRARTEFTPDLCALRAVLAAGGSFPVPDLTVEHRDWYDGELIRDAAVP